eukprot:682879-Pleurochrysis_carterae.AAC.1
MGTKRLDLKHSSVPNSKERVAHSAHQSTRAKMVAPGTSSLSRPRRCLFFDRPARTRSRARSREIGYESMHALPTVDRWLQSKYIEQYALTQNSVWADAYSRSAGNGESFQFRKSTMLNTALTCRPGRSSELKAPPE